MSTLNVTDFHSIDDALDACEAIGADLGFDGGIHVTSGFRWRNGVKLVANGNACIQWAGGPGTLARSPLSGTLQDCGMVGLDIDARDASTVLEWRSTTESVLRDVLVRADNPAAIVLDMDCNDAGPVNEWGNRNTAYNEVSNLRQRGRCGTLLRTAGLGPAGGPPLAVTTLNSFFKLDAAGVCGTGIDLASWCDSNQFEGVTHLNLVGDGAVGLVANSEAPAENLGVYANHFSHLAVDSFGVMTGRVGLRLNRCHSMHIGHYANGPAAEGGQYQISPLASGYRIALLQEAGGYQVIDPAWIAGYLFAFAVGAANQLVVDKAGNTIQRGIAHVGAGVDIDPAGVKVGAWRTGAGHAYVDLVADPAQPEYSLRLIAGPGANGHAWLYHRGTGDLILQAQDSTGRVVLAGSDGVPRLAVSKDGIRFNNQTKPRVVGGLYADTLLRAALAQLGIITNV